MRCLFTNDAQDLRVYANTVGVVFEVVVNGAPHCVLLSSTDTVALCHALTVGASDDPPSQPDLPNAQRF